MMESLANISVGFIVALISQMLIFPVFNIHVPFTTDLAITAWFTIISLIRSYILRRWFNGLKFQRQS